MAFELEFNSDGTKIPLYAKSESEWKHFALVGDASSF